MASLRPAWQWAGMLTLSLILCLALEAAALPAARLIGPMLVAIGFGAGGASIRVPRAGFIAAQALIGTLVAEAVRPSILATLMDNWPLMTLVVLTTVVAAAVVGWLMVRFGDLPGSTAAWGSSPGAAGAMVAMAEDFGADPRLVAFMQYFRVLLVVLSASLVSRLWLGDAAAPAPAAAPADGGVGFAPWPLLETLAVATVAALAGLKSRIPAGGLLLPLVVGAVLKGKGWLDIHLPGELLDLTYAVLGWYIGLRFTRAAILQVVRAVPQMLLAILALIALCGGSAWLLTVLLGTDGLTAFLATSPGGLDSVAIIAMGSHADLSFVLAIQTLRLMVVIVTGPALARLISRHAPVRPAGNPGWEL